MPGRQCGHHQSERRGVMVVISQDVGPLDHHGIVNPRYTIVGAAHLETPGWT